MRPPSSSSSSSPAFTMIELAVSIAMAGIIAVTATSVFSLINGTVRSSQVSARLTEQSRAALEYLLDEGARAAGGQVPTRASLIVEPDCAARERFADCRGTDRLTVVQALAGYRACPVVSVIAGNAAAGTITVGRLPGVGAPCCLADAPTVDNPLPKPVLQQQISSCRDRLRDLERLRLGSLI